VQEAVAAVLAMPGLEAVLVNCCSPQASRARMLWKTGAVLFPVQLRSHRTGDRKVAVCASHTKVQFERLFLQAVAAALPVLRAAVPPGVRLGAYANGFKTTTSGKRGSI
jgi:hypothetical protein